MTDREAFEAHMLKLNPCTRLARQKELLGGHYRTTTVQRAWELWQASRKQMAKEAAAVCAQIGDHEEDMGRSKEAILCTIIHDAIRSLATPTEGKTA